RFLFVGRHVYQKGIDVLLEATALVRSRLPEPFVLEPAFGVRLRPAPRQTVRVGATSPGPSLPEGRQFLSGTRASRRRGIGLDSVRGPAYGTPRHPLHWARERPAVFRRAGSLEPMRCLRS